ADHRLLSRGIRIVKLKRVGPAVEVRIPAMSEKQITTLTLDPYVILRSAGQVKLAALDEVFGMIFDPGMAKPHVIGIVVEHEFEDALLEALAQPRQCRVTAEIGVHRIAGDCESRARNVFVAQVRQSFLKLLSPFWIAARNPLGFRARLPNA